ncbi:CubicO group peptidase (beta-lactamase class C family) [Nonomuraea thailandensis]|uniref:CubicO group peptidase (Beta-lactamase class C family) n=1 Tax=Nonomuraea thailandensis TaxID=1188745 RepID=A0A9X2K956_9ACTN|nr:serine hydrolase domain-containing protein [Nonomuraea thailandensis]MCP2365392.1 CubicO group peptidase (beta-lactamase class C family) [Nonomuraea thailandensis]
MNNNALHTAAARIREQAAAYCAANHVPGFVAGVHQGGEQIVVAHGTANLTTGAPMLEDTGFLFGSVTKVLTTTLVLQQVDKGVLDLDTPVVTYLPEFALNAPGAADKILVRHLISHTNGIDADLYFPDAKGRDALKTYVAGLAGACGVLFEPGEQLSYSNGGMIVAGRLLEVVTGLPFPELLARDIYTPVGMHDSSTSAEQAILRGTAIGHFPDPETMEARPTGMFTLPDTWGPAGGTPIGTVADLLAFGRTHLAGGVSPSGTRVLSAASTALMRQISYDMGSPNTPPMGMGWVCYPFGDTTVLAMSGASPGGVSLLCVIPEHDLVLASFGNTPGAIMLQDQLLQWLLTEHLGVAIPTLITETEQDVDLTPYVGTYRSDQLRIDVSIVDGQLEERTTYEPADPSQERVFTEFAGGTTSAPPQRYVAIRPGLFAPAGFPLEAFDGYLRLLLVSYHDVRDGQARFRNGGGRLARRA